MSADDIWTIILAAGLLGFLILFIFSCRKEQREYHSNPRHFKVKIWATHYPTPGHQVQCGCPNCVRYTHGPEWGWNVRVTFVTGTKNILNDSGKDFYSHAGYRQSYADVVRYAHELSNPGHFYWHY